MKSEQYIYQRILKTLKEEIENGTWTPGDRLPSLDQLRDRFEVNRLTARRAVEELKEMGLVYSLPAKGTYVGRAFNHGLGAMGKAGVTTALNVIHKELDTSMALCGRVNIEDCDRDILLVPEGFEGHWQA